MPRTRSVAWAELKLGIVGVIGIILVVVVIVAVGGQGGFFWQRYPLKMQFQDAQGLKTGAVVRLSGKDVGTVTAVEFFGTGIDVSFQVSKDVRPLITGRSVGSIGSLSLLGESMVEIKAMGDAAGDLTPVPDWGYVKTIETGAIGDLTTSAAKSLDQAGQLLAEARAGRGTLGKLLTDDSLYRELEQFVGSAAAVTKELNQGKGTIGGLMTDPTVHNSLKASLDNLQTMTARINAGQGALGRFLNDDAMSRSISTTMTNLQQTSDRLASGQGTVGKLLTDQELYDRLNGMVGRVDQVVAGLESGRGTAGQLLHDQQLYENMNKAVTELRDLLADIRKDPKKFLRVSVSIF